MAQLENTLTMLAYSVMRGKKMIVILDLRKRLIYAIENASTKLINISRWLMSAVGTPSR
jgi:hypothetical protein